MADADRDVTGEGAGSRAKAPLCRHLRSSGMYVYTDGSHADPEDGYDNSIYWCLKTMKGFGPDDDFVGGAECRDATRACYEPA